MPAPDTASYSGLERVAFRRFGSGRDLLLIMGQDGAMTWWEPSWLSALAHHYTVVTFDLPGVGYSEPEAAGAMTIDSWADDTAGLIESLGLVAPTVLGWGLGGDVALALAERHPGAAASLVLVDTSAGGLSVEPPTASIEDALASPWATAASLASFMFEVSTTGAGTTATVTSTTSALATARTTWLAGVTGAVPDDLTQSSIEGEKEVGASVWSSNALAAAASAVKIPALVVYGASDLVCPPADDVALAALISGSQTLALPRTGYAAMFEDQSAFVAALEQFTG